MRLVEVLVKKWEEWPSRCEYAVCDSDGEVRAIGTDCKHDFYPDDDVDEADRLSGIALLAWSDGKRVTSADWEAERAKWTKPTQQEGKWIRNRGGNRPAPITDGMLIDVRYRNGDIECRLGEEQYRFTHDGDDVDVMAWRPHTEENPEEMTMDEVIDLFVACADDPETVAPGAAVRARTPPARWSSTAPCTRTSPC
jgi:hypothetical protein